MSPTPKWPSFILKLAAVYNILWGAWVVLFPEHLFEWTGIAHPNYPGIWQCVGMIVGVYGIGYWCASYDFQRHWPVILVGFLGKIFGPIGFLQSAITGALPWSWGVTILFNDLIWWLPFGAMLYLAFKHHSDPLKGMIHRSEPSKASAHPQLSNGDSLDEFLKSDQKRLFVFIRHAGCTFCRETLSKIAAQRKQIESLGLQIVVVHMSSIEAGDRMMQSYQLSDLVHVSDPECTLYRQVGLKRGTFVQLFGPSVWWKGFKAAILSGYGFGKLEGDGFQLGGSVVMQKGKILASFPCADATTSIQDANEISAGLACNL